MTAPMNGQQVMLKTANDLVRMCQDRSPRSLQHNSADAVGYGFCLGLFNGLIASNVYTKELKLGQPLFCATSDVFPDEARKVFLRWMNDHPEQLHEDALSVAIVSLRKAFPCEWDHGS
jgi:hypothetical protein